jgi:hypothetical protein
MSDDRQADRPIIDLATHARFKLDLGEHARHRISAAQQRLGISTEEFAAALNDLVEWDVTAESVEKWMTSVTPPADLLLAADLLVRRGDRGADNITIDMVGSDIVEYIIAERFADLAAVFTSRAAFASALPPHVLFDGAQDISMVGLSLNLLCQQYAEHRVEELIRSGCTIRCLFLEPYGDSIAAREREEDYPPGHLSALTDMNIQIMARLRARLSDDGQAQLRLRTYDEPVRFNIILVDHHTAVVQPYMPALRGIDSPTFLLRRIPVGPALMPAFERIFKWTWDRGKPVG